MDHVPSALKISGRYQVRSVEPKTDTNVPGFGGRPDIYEIHVGAHEQTGQIALQIDTCHQSYTKGQLVASHKVNGHHVTSGQVTVYFHSFSLPGAKSD